MTLTAAAIEADLREALPEGLRPHAASLARLLSDAANGARPEAHARFASDPAFSAAFEALAGKRVGPAPAGAGAKTSLGLVDVIAARPGASRGSPL